MFNPPTFVQPGQVYMCRFEDCWDNAKAQICTPKSIVANIKPEIGKVRPVVIVLPHKRHRLAVVIPFTTQKPKKETYYTVFVPQGSMPGVLARRECWALCDMIKTVSLDRLQLPFSGINNLRLDNKSTRLCDNIFNDIKNIVFFKNRSSLV